MIETHSLRIDYDNVTAVQDLDLKIQGGEIFGLVGPNGAGKTSTIKALAGILEPTYGEIKISGYDIELEQESAFKKLGYMPDFSPVYDNLKAWEYLYVFATAYRIDRGARMEKVRHWLEKFNLTAKQEEFVRNLSRGMRQRLVLAKTLLPEPSVLLLDEPASGMDPIARMELRTILKEAAARGAAVLISSHILTELSEFCTSIGIMEKGRMVVSGSMDEIRQRIGSQGRLIIRLGTTVESARQSLLNTLRSSPLLRDLQENSPAEFQAYFLGRPEEETSLLKSLVEQGHPVAGFHIEKENMEDIFFKVGAREVS